VQFVLPFLPYAAMLVLLLGWAFFSASEAALFSLNRGDRRSFERGNRAQRRAAQLLKAPDRLLTTVLFWSLALDLAYFALASLMAIRLGERGTLGGWGVAAWSGGAVLAAIVVAEVLPKNFGVLQSRYMAALFSLPLAVAVRVSRPLLPVLRTLNVLSRRLIWPGFQPEPYLEVGDLERAVSLSTPDAALMEQEEVVLHNILALSEFRVDELMRPRTRITLFRPGMSLAELNGEAPRSGYVLLTEPNSDEIAAAIPLNNLSDIPDDRVDHLAEPVGYVPWCTSVAAALDQMRRDDERVLVVVNERGESMGIVTYDDILDNIFTRTASRSARLLDRHPIREVSPGVWQVTGMTSLRRLTRHFGIPRRPGKTVTVAGVFQESLGRLPVVGDECRWADFRLRVLDAPEQGQLLVELTKELEPAEDAE
jgi:CBS domain containing-hemolysin-like protein